jgi:hypothetical protein
VSRRWYSHDGHMVYVGWDRAHQQFFLSIVTLCTECGGLGEEFGTEVPCMKCVGEGVTDETNVGSKDLDDIARALTERGMPFADYMRSDLEHDRATDAAELVHDYDQDPRRSAG